MAAPPGSVLPAASPPEIIARITGAAGLAPGVRQPCAGSICPCQWGSSGDSSLIDIAEAAAFNAVADELRRRDADPTWDAVPACSVSPLAPTPAPRPINFLVARIATVKWQQTLLLKRRAEAGEAPPLALRPRLQAVALPAGTTGPVIPKGNNRSPAAVEWTCACGFLNSPTNRICGGNGHLGCSGAKPIRKAAGPHPCP